MSESITFIYEGISRLIVMQVGQQMVWCGMKGQEKMLQDHWRCLPEWGGNFN